MSDPIATAAIFYSPIIIEIWMNERRFLLDKVLTDHFRNRLIQLNFLPRFCGAFLFSSFERIHSKREVVMTLEQRVEVLEKTIAAIRKTAPNETVSERMKSGLRLINKTIAACEASAVLR